MAKPTIATCSENISTLGKTGRNTTWNFANKARASLSLTVNVLFLRYSQFSDANFSLPMGKNSPRISGRPPFPPPFDSVLDLGLPSIDLYNFHTLNNVN